MTLELVTLKRVPLIKTGTYNLESGLTTFTLDDLHAAAGAVDDPAIRSPIIKFGHEKAQLTQQPAVGRILNMEVEDDTETLFGDYVGVPKWLADIMPIAYPDRSVEAWRGVETATGKRHGVVITAVSLLGEDPPGVSTLEDLYELFYPDAEPIAASGSGPVAVIIKGGGRVPSDGPIRATVEVEDVRRLYYEQLEGSQMWWWIRAVRLDPNELIVDDDEGHLYRVPFTVAGDDVTFGEPVEVKIRYEDVAAAMMSAGAPLAIFASRAESRPESANRTKEDEVADTDSMAAVKEKLGLSADATEEEILQALDAREDPADPEEQDDDDVNDDDDAADDDDEETETESTVKLPDGMVAIDQETLQGLQVAAQDGQKAHQRLEKNDRDALLAAAVKAGKFPPSRLSHYVKLYDADPKGTRNLVANLAAGVVPVSEIGTAGSDGELESAQTAYPDSFLPEIAAAKKSGEFGVQPLRPGTVIRERV